MDPKALIENILSITNRILEIQKGDPEELEIYKDLLEDLKEVLDHDLENLRAWVAKGGFLPENYPKFLASSEAIIKALAPSIEKNLK